MATIYQKRTDNRTAQISVSDLVQDDRADVPPTNELIQEEAIVSDSLFVPTRISQAESRVKKFPNNLIEIMEDIVKSPYQTVKVNKTSEYTDFQKSIKGLLSLEEIDEEEIDDEDDVVKPSSYAFYEAYKLLMEIQAFFKDAFPYCSSSLEARGGIYLVWDNLVLQRRVWVGIPVDESLGGAVFYRESDKSKFINLVDSQRVIQLLLWLHDSQMSVDI